MTTTRFCMSYLRLPQLLGFFAVYVACLVPGAPAFGRTLHVFIAADETDPRVGQYVKYDAMHVSMTMVAGVTNRDLQFHNIARGQLSGDNIRQAIRNAQITNNDAIFFYYSGHGGYTGGEGHVLLMKGGQDRLRRDDLISELKGHRAALTVVVTDACFNLIFRQPPRAAAPAAAAPETAPLFRRLFFQTNGFIDLNSCRRGEVAATGIVPPDGSVFTAMLTTSLTRHMRDEDASFGWKELFNEVTDRTGVRFKQLYPEGHNVEVEGDVVTQTTQTPHAFAMNIQQIQGGGGNDGSNSISSTRLGVDVTAQNGIVLVSEIQNGGPATRLNYRNDGKNWYLERGDRIVSINGDAVDCVNCFARAVRNSNAQMQFVVKSGTDGGLYPFTARLNPLGQGGGVGDGGQQKLRFGVWVESYNGPGAKVVKVQPNSPATRVIHPSGQEWFIEPGDIITQVNGRETNGQDAVTSAVFASPREMTVEVIGARDGKRYHFRVQLWDVN